MTQVLDIGLAVGDLQGAKRGRAGTVEHRNPKGNQDNLGKGGERGKSRS